MTHTLISPLDMHLHLRDAQMLKVVAPLSAYSFSAGLVMPNVVPPITTIEALLAYKKRIVEASGNNVFDPLMTLFFYWIAKHKNALKLALLSFILIVVIGGMDWHIKQSGVECISGWFGFLFLGCFCKDKDFNR